MIPHRRARAASFVRPPFGRGGASDRPTRKLASPVMADEPDKKKYEVWHVRLHMPPEFILPRRALEPPAPPEEPSDNCADDEDHYPPKKRRKRRRQRRRH